MWGGVIEGSVIMDAELLQWLMWWSDRVTAGHPDVGTPQLADPEAERWGRGEPATGEHLPWPPQKTLPERRVPEREEPRDGIPER